MNFNPMQQFAVTKLIPLYLPHGIDVSISNAAIYMLFSVIVIAWIAFLSKSYKKMFQKDPEIQPTRGHVLLNSTYKMVETMLEGTAGYKALKFMPLVFTVFLFILVNDLIGMIPGSFSVMSQIIVTFSIAITLFVGMTLYGIWKHGFGFLSLFLPKGAPAALLPLMFIVELGVYLARPISLSLRLAANVMAGHIILKVKASLIIASGIMGFMPLTLLVILTGFEFFVSILQAYIFTMLVCVYMNDAINMHHH